jgi:hypothetical protein
MRGSCLSATGRAVLLSSAENGENQWQIKVTGKGGGQRIEPVPDFVVEWIREITPEGTKGPLFLNKKTGQPYKRFKPVTDRVREKSGHNQESHPPIS